MESIRHEYKYKNGYNNGMKCNVVEDMMYERNIT